MMIVEEKENKKPSLDNFRRAYVAPQMSVFDCVCQKALLDCSDNEGIPVCDDGT